MTDPGLIAKGRTILESGKYAPTNGAAQGVADLPHLEDETELSHAWDSSPDAAELLDDVRAFLVRFVAYPSTHALIAHVLWIVHCWFMECWESTPRIAFLSPEPGSGKSRALEVTEPLVPRAVHAVNTTPAYLFRKVSDPDGMPTILYDEIDTVFGPKAKDNEEVRGMLNAGHRSGATAGRCVVRGKEVFTEELPAYCAVALAGLDDLPDTIMTRSVVVRMRRRAADEPVEPWRRRIAKPDADKLAARLRDWSNAVNPIEEGWPTMPPGVDDRDADVWEALLAVADAAGGHWPKSARVAAVTAVTAARRRPPSIGVLLLRDIKKVFDAFHGEKLLTEAIIRGLSGMEESPWATLRKGEPIDSRGLANRLRKYGISSKAQRVGEDVFKGYARSQFEDAWKRYVNDLEVDEDPANPHLEGNESVTPVTDDTTSTGVATDVTAVTNAKGSSGEGFTPPAGPGRCVDCGCHVATQGHSPSCTTNTN
jgi:hypothetical protein